MIRKINLKHSVISKVSKNEGNLLMRYLFIFAAVLLLFIGCEKPKEDQRVVATVENGTLTLDDLQQQIPPQIRPNLSSVQLREYVLRWINNEVLYQEALRQRLDERPEMQKEFEQLRKELLINKLVESTLSNEVAVSEKEIRSFYDANRESFILEDDIVHAYHIVVDSQNEANEIRRRLKSGEKFEDIAKEVSQDSLEAEDWDLGYFTRDEVIPEISKAVFNMQVGSYSYPIKSEYGYHIVMVVDKQKKGEVKKYDLLKDEIRLKLEAKKKQNQYQNFLLQTKSKYKIENKFPKMEHAILDSLLAKR